MILTALRCFLHTISCSTLLTKRRRDLFYPLSVNTATVGFLGDLKLLLCVILSLRLYHFISIKCPCTYVVLLNIRRLTSAVSAAIFFCSLFSQQTCLPLNKQRRQEKVIVHILIKNDHIAIGVRAEHGAKELMNAHQ